jgi:hypothetical protein
VLATPIKLFKATVQVEPTWVDAVMPVFIKSVSVSAVPLAGAPAERLIAIGVFAVRFARPDRTANRALPSGQVFLMFAWKLGIFATMLDPLGTSPCLNA